MPSAMGSVREQAGSLWLSGALHGKVGGAFTSSATQHGGNEATLFSIIANLMHFGMVIVGLPYSHAGQMTLEEIVGGAPYGATTITGGKGERQPSKLELASQGAARSRGCRSRPEKLKNIAEPIRVYSLEVGRPAQAKPAPAPALEKSAPPRLSIVVLPFANIGGDPEQEHFVDGVTESLTTDLSRIRRAVVIARNTAFTYKGKPLDVKTIGRELNVRYVLVQTPPPLRIAAHVLHASFGFRRRTSGQNGSTKTGPSHG